MLYAPSSTVPSRGDGVTAAKTPIRLLYDELFRLADDPRATSALAAVAFVEACILPAPPNALLVPMILNSPKSAWRFAAVASTASVIGSCFGYAIGHLFYGLVAVDCSSNGLGHWMDDVHRSFARWGMEFIVLTGLTPIPFKLIAMAGGAARYSLPMFVLACTITRVVHFFLLAGILRYRSPQVSALLERHLERIGPISVILSGATAVLLVFTI
jgi:membrane protein YqaA with SNARE-associated domain